MKTDTHRHTQTHRYTYMETDKHQDRHTYVEIDIREYVNMDRKTQINRQTDRHT